MVEVLPQVSRIYSIILQKSKRRITVSTDKCVLILWQWKFESDRCHTEVILGAETHTNWFRIIHQSLLSHKLVYFFIRYYNIPRACLLNRSPVPAMDLKNNRSGLWRHMLETCRRLRRLSGKHSNNVTRHDKTPVKSTLLSRVKNILSRDMSFMSRRSDIMLWL